MLSKDESIGFVAPANVKKNSQRKYVGCPRKSSKSPAFGKPQGATEDTDVVLQEKYNSWVFK